MKLYSTRNINECLNPKDAIIKGLSNDGGLYCPKYEDIVAKKFNIGDLLSNDYKKTAKLIFSLLFDDFTSAELDNCINQAYSKSNFGEYENNVAPVTKIGNNFLMELYHGPTSAFKDVALTILPHFLTTAYKSKNENKKIYILTATSGDTGKAALSGFKDVENVFITVFYPTDGVSNIQKLQMQTAEGNNVSVVAIKGDFDDCQRLVKDIYTDENIKKLCSENNVVLSSANSINIGRLVPQIVYYVQTYIDLVNKKEIILNEKVNFIVPTGNFGDILAGYIAKLLGTPIDKLVCASNDNNVLTDFINTGIYDKNRELYKTISPSMDILVSSNLERLLFLLSGNDDKLINELMTGLNTKGVYKISAELLSKVKQNFVAEFATQNESQATIKNEFEKDNRIIDTHTAVAYKCFEKCNFSGDSTNVVLSTASPYKFARDVLKCICSDDLTDKNDFYCLDKLNELTKEPIPNNLFLLKTKQKRFDTVLDYNESKNFVIDKIKNL